MRRVVLLGLALLVAVGIEMMNPQRLGQPFGSGVGGVFYVAPDGTGEWPCRASAPCGHRRAWESVRPGDTLTLAPGTYR